MSKVKLFLITSFYEHKLEKYWKYKDEWLQFNLYPEIFYTAFFKITAHLPVRYSCCCYRWRRFRRFWRQIYTCVAKKGTKLPLIIFTTEGYILDFSLSTTFYLIALLNFILVNASALVIEFGKFFIVLREFRKRKNHINTILTLYTHLLTIYLYKTLNKKFIIFFYHVYLCRKDL